MRMSIRLSYVRVPPTGNRRRGITSSCFFLRYGLAQADTISVKSRDNDSWTACASRQWGNCVIAGFYVTDQVIHVDMIAITLELM